MKSDLSIAVIGAGMGGLASAAALRKVGIDVTVYEQARQFARLGAGIQIGCNAMHVLRGLGIEPAARRGTFYPRSWNNSIGIRRDPVRHGLRHTGRRESGAPYLLAHRATSTRLW